MNEETYRIDYEERFVWVTDSKQGVEGCLSFEWLAGVDPNDFYIPSEDRRLCYLIARDELIERGLITVE